VAYDDVDGPFGTEFVWGPGDGGDGPFGTEFVWNLDLVDNFAIFLSTAASSALKTYLNRKFHSGSATYHYWFTDGTPDADMSETTPPETKSEYTDHVVIEIKLQS